MNLLFRYLSFFENMLLWVPLIVKQHFGQQTLRRSPEPTPLMEDDEIIHEYNRAAETRLFISYACALEIIYKCMGNVSGEAIDLACGPGNPAAPGASRPHPHQAMKSMMDMGSDPARTAFVGDTSIDIDTALRAGCIPVAVTWGYGFHPDGYDTRARFHLHSPMRPLEYSS